MATRTRLLAQQRALRASLRRQRTTLCAAAVPPPVLEDPPLSSASTPKRPVCGSDERQRAFEALTTGELARGWFVLSLCSSRLLVQNSEALIRLSYQLFGKTVTNVLIGETMFKHFCGGEDVAGLAPRLARLRDAGIGGDSGLCC